MSLIISCNDDGGLVDTVINHHPKYLNSFNVAILMNSCC